MSKIKVKTKDLFLTNPLLRKFKIFVNKVLKPFLVKFLVLVLSLIIIVIIGLKLFKPDFIEKSLTKAKFYFLHYLNLDNYQFQEIKIFGNKRVPSQQIIDIVKKTQDKIFVDNEEYQPLIQNLIDEIKANLPWVNQITISRNMPNILNVYITEYEPFAIWNSDDKKFIIDKDYKIGKLNSELDCTLKRILRLSHVDESRSKDYEYYLKHFKLKKLDTVFIRTEQEVI